MQTYSIQFADRSWYSSSSNGRRTAFASFEAAAKRLKEMRRNFGQEPLTAESRAWDEALVVPVTVKKGT